MEERDGEQEIVDVEEIEDGLPALEKKYQRQMRQIVTQKLDLPISALLGMLDSQIQLNPNFQRRDRWDETRQSRLIESLLMNVPIPPVFLGEDEYGQYVVLDGRQRLTAVAKFLKNDLVLKNLKVWEELNGSNYQDMVKREQEKYLTRRFMQAIVILKESSPIVKYDVFDRLNTGGIRANEMEIRNAVYRGKFTDLLHELSRTPEFCQLWDIPVDAVEAESHRYYQEMEDLELVLRFFALSDYETMSLQFKDYLSEFMNARNGLYKQDLQLETNDRTKFTNAVKNCFRIFGRKAFFKPNDKRSTPLADALMVALGNENPESISDEEAEAVRTQIAKLFTNETFNRAIDSGTNGRGKIQDRITLAKAAIDRALV